VVNIAQKMQTLQAQAQSVLYVFSLPGSFPAHYYYNAFFSFRQGPREYFFGQRKRLLFLQQPLPLFPHIRQLCQGFNHGGQILDGLIERLKIDGIQILHGLLQA